MHTVLCVAGAIFVRDPAFASMYVRAHTDCHLRPECMSVPSIRSVQCVIGHCACFLSKLSRLHDAKRDVSWVTSHVGLATRLVRDATRISLHHSTALS